MGVVILLVAAEPLDAASAAKAVAGTIPTTVIAASRPESARFHLDLMLWERDFNIKSVSSFIKFVSMEKGLHADVQPFGWWYSIDRPGLFILGIGGLRYMIVSFPF